MICGFPKFPRICWRFCLVILYSNIRLIVLYQFGIWCCWMFSYGSHICAWMLFRKRHNKFLFLDFLRLVWYLLCIGHYWLGIFLWVGIGVFLYSYMFLQYHLLGDWLLRIDFRLLLKHFCCIGDEPDYFPLTPFGIFVFFVNNLLTYLLNRFLVC